MHIPNVATSGHRNTCRKKNWNCPVLETLCRQRQVSFRQTMLENSAVQSTQFHSQPELSGATSGLLVRRRHKRVLAVGAWPFPCLLSAIKMPPRRRSRYPGRVNSGSEKHHIVFKARAMKVLGQVGAPDIPSTYLSQGLPALPNIGSSSPPPSDQAPLGNLQYIGARSRGTRHVEECQLTE
jgi:hypothetical protein